MKSFKTIVRAFMLLILTVSMTALQSCDKPEKEPDPVTKGTITGVVKDNSGAPIAEVNVAVSGASLSATTAVDGSYSIQNVDMTKTNTLVFTKKGYLEVSVTIKQNQFSAEYVATANVSMEFAGAVISGKVTDASNAGAAMEGVNITVEGLDLLASTAADGTYKLEDLAIQNYTLTFAKGGYTSVTKTVASTDFVNGVATLDAELGAKELLRGMTADDLKSAGKWLYSDYRGGRNGDDYPHFDWSVDFLCTADFSGWWEEQNEGTTIQIRNNADEGHQNNPADLEVFDSYIYGSKMITEENKHLTLRLRTHAASTDAPAYFGVQVIDLNAAEPVATLLTEEPQTLASEDYTNFYYDLSAYVGKEVVIAVGTFRAATGDYWKQLVIRRITFSSSDVEDWGWPEGTPINDDLADWKLSREAISSNMVQPYNTLFTGVSPVGGDRDNYRDGYRSWKDAHHIGYDWTLVPRYKDAEPFASEGFVIKTNGGGTPVDLVTPQAYFYGKFNISANTLVLKARTFSSDMPTFFKFTVIEADTFAVTDLVPTNATAGEKADGNCWKFCHEDGGWDNPEGYAEFTYDISAFNGKTVVLALGVYKGETNDGEQKLSIYSVEMK